MQTAEGKFNLFVAIHGTHKFAVKQLIDKADQRTAYNLARRLKTLNGLTPYDYIAKVWTSEPARLIVNSIRQMPGPSS